MKLLDDLEISSLSDSVATTRLQDVLKELCSLRQSVAAARTDTLVLFDLVEWQQSELIDARALLAGTGVHREPDRGQSMEAQDEHDEEMVVGEGMDGTVAAFDPKTVGGQSLGGTDAAYDSSAAQAAGARLRVNIKPFTMFLYFF